MPFTEDEIAWPLMVAIAARLEIVLEECGLPGVCRSVPVPGPLAVLDAAGGCANPSGDCGNGQAWVRLSNEYPSSQFPVADQRADCDTPLAYVLEVGISRCIPTGTANRLSGYKAPAVASIVEATRLQMADKKAIRRAIKSAVGEDTAFVLGNYEPLQLSGDVGGGFWTVTIWSA